MGNARLRLPSQGNLSFDVIEYLSFDLQPMLEPLASFASSSSLNTNLSRSVSLAWLNDEENTIPLLTDVDHPTEIVIPREPSLISPPMSLVNVTGERGLHFHSIDLNPLLPNVSIHWEIHPLNISLSYAFIYRFDRASIFDTSQLQIDGWTIFYPSSNTQLSPKAPILDRFRFVE